MQNNNNLRTVVVTGSMSWDTIMDFPSRFVDYLNPNKLHQLNVSFVVDSLEKQIGGTATNIAYAASQVVAYLQRTTTSKDTVTVNVVGGLGKDAGGHMRFFKKNKIDTSRIIIDKRMYSAAGSVITDVKDNQIWGFYYGASSAAKKVLLHDFKPRSSIIIISANYPDVFLHFQHHAQKLKIPYMYDPGMSLSWIKDSDLKNGVMKAQFLIGNDYEMTMIQKRIKKTIKELTKAGVNVIITLGDKGVEYYPSVIPVKTGNQKSNLDSHFRGNDRIVTPAVPGVKAVDPTGAGDAWRGGFIAAQAKGLPIRDSLIMGNVVASFAVEHYGCVNYHIVSRELKRRMESLRTKD